MPSMDEPEGGQEVIGPSGATFVVMSEDEKEFFENRVGRYASDNHLSNVSDLADLDRILIMELMCYRWGVWLSQESDYDGNNVDLDAIQKALGDYSKELRLIKKSIGIDKVSRDREKGENFADYLENLRARAKEFGVMREEQLTSALTLFNELKALITFHLNCTDEERRENNIEQHDLIEWVIKIALPEFDRIDSHFQENQQRFWVKSI